MSTNRSIYIVPDDDNIQDYDPDDTALSYWASIIGPVYPYMVHDVTRWVSQGIQDACIMAAMDSTCIAPRPSWAYLRAIMRALSVEGVRTAPQYHARQAAHGQRSKRVGRTVSAQQYTQRTYTAEEWDQVYTPIAAGGSGS